MNGKFNIYQMILNTFCVIIAAFEWKLELEMYKPKVYFNI